MTHNTSTNETNNLLNKLSALTRVLLVTMVMLSAMTGMAAADNHEPSEEELCSNAAVDIIDRVMFFVFNLFPIVTFTAFGGAFALEKMASNNSNRSSYREWRNRAGGGTVGLLVLGQMGGWFMGTFLNVSPACMGNFQYLTMAAPIYTVDTLSVMPF